MRSIRRALGRWSNKVKSVLILIAIFFIVRALKKKLESGKKETPPAPQGAPPREQAPSATRAKAEEMVLDQVCGSYVPISAAIVSNKDGKTAYFCSEECRDRL